MKYIKYFETFEEYESWINIKENAEEVYRTGEKICVDGVILSHTYDEVIREDKWMVRKEQKGHWYTDFISGHCHSNHNVIFRVFGHWWKYCCLLHPYGAVRNSQSLCK